MDIRTENKFFTDIKKYYFDDPYLFKYCPDQIMRRCVADDEHIRILTFCHSKACGGHFSAKKTAEKIFLDNGAKNASYLFVCRILFPSVGITGV